MNWKEFLKPDLRTIFLTMLLIFFFLPSCTPPTVSCAPYYVISLGVAPILKITMPLFLGNILCFSNNALIVLEIILLYIVSCLIKRKLGIRVMNVIIIVLILMVPLVGMLYIYLSGVYESRLGAVIMIDESTTCDNLGYAKIWLRNDGTLMTTTDKVIICGTKSDGTTLSATTCNESAVPIMPGGYPVSCEHILLTKGRNNLIIQSPFLDVTQSLGRTFTINCP